MSGKSFISMYTGAPQLGQLNDDLREAETTREAPRLSVPEALYKAMVGESWCAGGMRYELVNTRDANTTYRETTLFDRSLGTFRLKTGGLAYFVLQA